MTTQQHLTYQRSFTLHSCHFNGGAVYKAYQDALDLSRQSDAASLSKAFTILNEDVLPHIHGHEFLVVVSVTKRMTDGNGYAIDDEALEALVMHWHRTNLSVQADFFQNALRATTENMAEVLRDMIEHNFDIEEKYISVTVHETKEIQATVVVQRQQPQVIVRGAHD